MNPLPRLVIRIRDQEADLMDGTRVVKTYSISSAANGAGCVAESGCTPTGLLRVAKKIGGGCAPGTVFRSRVATGEVWSYEPDNPLFGTTEDLVLTRILWLEGLEPHNSNTLERYIYLHGTNDEKRIGQAVSHGCIRFTNADIQELYDYVEEGACIQVL